MEEGLIARVEYLNAKVAVANAQVELDAAERDVAIVSEGLSNILVAVGPVEPGSTLFMVADVPSRETFQDYVNEEHPILESVAAKLDLAEQGVRAEEGAERPTVYAFGMHELVTGDLTMLDPKWALGVGFQYPLFDGRQGRHKVEAARAVRDKVGHLQQKARRDLRSLVLKRYEELQKARSQYEAFETTLDLARENLRVRNRAFEEGLATSVEVVDAALSLARAQLGRLKAAFDLDLALFQLLEASGRTQEYNQYLARAIPVPEEPLQRDGAGGGNGAAAAGGDSVKQPATEQSKP
jgi:outer membrane protein TolC